MLGRQRSRDPTAEQPAVAFREVAFRKEVSMNKTLFAWLPTTALLAGALACTSTSSHDDDGAGGSSSIGGSSASGGSSAAGGSSATTTTNGGGSGGSGGTNVTTGSLGGAAGASGETTNGSAGSAGAGDGGTGGSGGTTSTPAGDPCEGSDVEPNDDDESTTLYEVGTAFDACLQSAEDVDFYEFSIPQDDRGGVATVSITEVGPNGDTSLALWAAADDGEFHSTGTNTEGASVYFHFNAAAGATFRLAVTNYVDVNEPNPYRLTIAYHQVPDEHEPNQVRGQAVEIEVDEDVEGYLFAGWNNSTGIPNEDWYDWYSVELEAGDTTFLIDVMASDIDHQIVLYDPLGTQIATDGTNTEGSSVQLEYEVPEAGTYFVRVNPYSAPPTVSNSLDIPEYASIPYTLSVTQ